MAEATTATGEPGAVGAVLPELVASFFTLSGAGFGEPPRNGFIERCEAAAKRAETKENLELAAAGGGLKPNRALYLDDGFDHDENFVARYGN